MSLSFYSLVTSVSFPFSFKSCHFPCMSCHCLKSYRISAHIRFKLCSQSFILHFLPWLFMLLFSFFTSSNVLLSSFHFTLLYLNAFHFRPLSFHVRYFPCPSIICSYPFIVPSCHVQNLTDRLFGMRDRGHRGGHTL